MISLSLFVHIASGVSSAPTSTTKSEGMDDPFTPCSADCAVLLSSPLG